MMSDISSSPVVIVAVLSSMAVGGAVGFAFGGPVGAGVGMAGGIAALAGVVAAAGAVYAAAYAAAGVVYLVYKAGEFALELAVEGMQSAYSAYSGYRHSKDLERREAAAREAEERARQAGDVARQQASVAREAEESSRQQASVAREAEERARQQASVAREEQAALKEVLEQAKKTFSKEGQRKINNIYDSIEMTKRMAKAQNIPFDGKIAKQFIKEKYGVDVCFLEDTQDTGVSGQLEGIQEALNLASIPQHLISKEYLPDDQGTVTESISAEEITVTSQADAKQKVTFVKAPAGDAPPKFFAFFNKSAFSKDVPAPNASISSTSTGEAKEAKPSLGKVTVLVLPRALQP